MKKISFLSTLLILGLTLFSSSCKKYEDGGLIGKAEKRISAHTWKLQSYLRNGNDETSSVLISNFTEQFMEDGTLNRVYNDKDDKLIEESGSWQFDNDKQQINLTGVGSIELTEETSTVSTSDYNIIRLKKDELWYIYENGGDAHEFHLTPN